MDKQAKKENLDWELIGGSEHIAKLKYEINYTLIALAPSNLL